MKAADALTKIKCENNQIITTQKLKKLGFTDYNIKDLVNKNILIKEKRGIYKVIIISKKIQRIQNKDLLDKEVFVNIKGGYIHTAIDNLYEYQQTKTNKENDKLEYILCLLLKEIVINKELINKLDIIMNNLSFNKQRTIHYHIITDILNKEYIKAKDKIFYIIQEYPNANNQMYEQFIYLINVIIKSHKRLLSEEYLYELFKKGEFNLAYQLLYGSKDKIKDNIVYQNVFEMLKQIKVIKEGYYKKEQYIHQYHNVIVDFNRALKSKDYKYAYKTMPLVLKTTQYSLEYKIYQKLLKEINNILKELEVNPNFYQISLIQSKINYLFYKKTIVDYETVLNVKILLEQKLSLEYNKLDNYLLELVNMIIISKENNLTINYFKNLDTRQLKYSRFDDNMKNGDYISTLKMLNGYKNLNNFYDEYNYLNFLNLQILLNTLEQTLKENEYQNNFKIDYETLANLIIIDKYKSEGIEEFNITNQDIIQEIKELDIDNLTPVKALNLLKKFKDNIERE